VKNLCTLSDWNYLPKGLALYKSLVSTSTESFKLYYLCLDETSYKKLIRLRLPNILPISLQTIERQNEELGTARANRPYNEYCWTLASYFCDWLLSKEDLEHVCYIDSDILFYADIDILYKEIGPKDVGIVAHRHNAVGDRDGAYNVGVIYFRGSKIGRECLYWWKDAVLLKKHPEYYGCGDQKYLEGFIPRYGIDNICVMDETFGHGAPWNYRLYDWSTYDQDHCITWNGKKQSLVFNHFSRMSYDLSTNTVNFTSGQYADHTLNFTVFNIPQVQKLYQNYYLELKTIHETWMVNGKHIKPLKIAVGMIVFEGEYILKQCLECIYPYASQILIAEGPVRFWQQEGRTTSTDGTNDILHSFPDPDNKITITHGQYTEKDDQCRAYMRFLRQDMDYIWNVDSDELFRAEDIEKIIQLLTDYQYTSVGLKSCSFYGGFERHIGGFEEACDQFLRIFKVYPGSTWKTHRPPTIIHPDDVKTLPNNHLDSDTLWEKHGVRMMHYSYLFPKQVKNKIHYYKNALQGSKCIDNYYEQVYLPWVLGDSGTRYAIEQRFQGVHEYKPEFRTPTFTKEFVGHHPESIQRDLEKLQVYFNEQLK
jgi:hypothetical protein